MTIPVNFNYHEYLATRREIAIVWSIEDVLEVRPDLNDDQAWDVLQLVYRSHDAGIGISWETLQLAAQSFFGEEPEEGGAV